MQETDLPLGTRASIYHDEEKYPGVYWVDMNTLKEDSLGTKDIVEYNNKNKQ